MANFIQDIKINFAWWLLRKSVKKNQRDSAFHNYSSAKKVGVIFNATQQDTYETARKYIKELTNKGLEVKALGFVDSKEVLDFYQKSVHFEYFSRKNLNWYSKPNNPNTQQFLETPFDILVDLSIVEDFPIQYIVGLSRAQFKVGCAKESSQESTERPNFYDFMLQLGEEKSLKYLIEQLEHYFGMIKKIG